MADAVPGRVGIKFCQPCLRKNTRNVADIYCEDCGEYQCKKCEKIHQLFPVMSKHILVSADKASNVGPKYDMKGLDQCKEHQKLIEFFCEDENEPCCGKCAVVSHRKCHHVVEIEKTTRLKDLDLSNIQREFFEIEDNIKKVVHHLDRSKNKFTNDAIEITDKIQTMKDKVNEMFENLKRTVSMDIAKFQKQAFYDVDTKTAICDSCIADLKQTVAEIQAVAEQGSPTQQLIMSGHFKDKGAELTTQADKLSVHLKNIVLKFDFDGALKLPPAKQAMPGKLKMNFIPVPKLSSGVMVSPRKNQKVSLKLLASIDLKECEGDVEEPVLSGLDFLPDGRLVTVDNCNKTCVVFNQNLERLNTFALSVVPQYLVVVSEDEVAITTDDGYKIIFLKISKIKDICVVRECHVRTKFQSISMIDDDSMLVGCIDDHPPVRVVSMRGEEGEIGVDFPTKSYPKVSCSACTYIRNFDKVVFSDRFAHTIYIYDRATNSRIEVKNVQIINEPIGIAVGPSDCLFVCCKRTNSLVQISHTGKIVSSYMLDITLPCFVCISKDNTRLAVSNCAPGKMNLQLYNIELVN